ncbi:MAG TPA: TolC family protein [Bacteroidia bacterium]|nr:TolC family protein [Bacteroidia bacterium]HRH09592.1 TolC family protein [Bacteroidia bacterium]HRH63404.1 TolC family protein [Bacteroidia bacterium]
MTKKISLLMHLFVALLFISRSWAQADATKSFTLKEALDYALKNNVNNLNASLDDQIAKSYNKEIRGIGFPQINGSFDVKDFVEIPTSLIPAEFFGGAPGSYAPVKFGTQYNSAASLTASQIVFSSDYFLALKASKTLLELSKKSGDRTRIETQVAVMKAYYAVLVFRENLKLLNTDLERQKTYYDQMKAYNENGMNDKTDVEVAELSYNNALASIESQQRLVQLTEFSLKFQMGMDINTPIQLSDSISLFDNVNENIKVDTKANFSNRIEYQLLENQRKLNHLELKRYRLSYLPSIGAYGSASAAAQRSKFDIFDTNKGWYPTVVIGATLNLPIFDGFQKHFKIQQTKLKIQKTENTIKSFESIADLEASYARANYQKSINNLRLQKKNIALAESVYNSSRTKYIEGVGSNLEIVNAETMLRAAHTAYYGALFDYLNSLVDWDKANGNIK